jgi:hypothetical protein
MSLAWNSYCGLSLLLTPPLVLLTSILLLMFPTFLAFLLLLTSLLLKHAYCYCRPYCCATDVSTNSAVPAVASVPCYSSVFFMLFNLLLTCSYRCCFIPGVPAMGVVSAAEPSLLQLSSLLPLALPTFLAGVPVFCF